MASLENSPAVAPATARCSPGLARPSVAILAGGRGTRLLGPFGDLPKPLVEIGGRPILWHVMQQYARHGFRDFVVALGHESTRIRQGLAGVLEGDWSVELVDTGDATATGGRIKRLAERLGGRTFMLTWTDGLSDLDLSALLDFHRAHGRLATVTAVHPPARFGRLELDGPIVTRFAEKPQARDEWVNGAFFVLEPGVVDRIAGDATPFEGRPLEGLAAEGELRAYRHEGFWQCMDTPHEHRLLEELWASGRAPWSPRDGG